MYIKMVQKTSKVSEINLTLTWNPEYIIISGFQIRKYFLPIQSTEKYFISRIVNYSLVHIYVTTSNVKNFSFISRQTMGITTQ